MKLWWFIKWWLDMEKIIANIIAEVKLNWYDVSKEDIIFFWVKNLDIDKLIQALAAKEYLNGQI